MNYQKREGSYEPYRIMATHLLFNFVGRPDFIAYNIRDKRLLSLQICRKLLRAPAAAWTVRSQRQFDEVSPYFDTFIFEGFWPDQLDQT